MVTPRRRLVLRLNDAAFPFHVRPLQVTYWVLRLPAGATKCLGKPSLRSDRFHEAANAQNSRPPFHAVGHDCKRNFGADVPENFHLEVRRSHPRRYRAEGMLHSLDPK